MAAALALPLIALLALQAGRIPVPDAAQQLQAEKEIRKFYKDDYASFPAGRQAFAQKMIPRGVQHKEPAWRFVMLREARDHGAAAGDVDSSLQAIDEMANLFVGIDAMADKQLVLLRIEKAAKTPEEMKAALEGSIRLIEEAIHLRKLEIAGSLLARTEKVVKASKEEALFSGRLADLLKRLKQTLQLEAAIDAARKAGLKDWSAPWTCMNGASHDVGRVNHNGRATAWRSHPIAPDRPYKWLRTVQLGRDRPSLHLEVSALDKEAPEDKIPCDWVLVVTANGTELLRTVILGSRWQSFDVDLSAYGGQTVSLEIWNAPGGAHPMHSERAFWDNIYLLPPAQAEALPIPMTDAFKSAVPAAAALAKAERQARDLLQAEQAGGFPSAAEKQALAQRILSSVSTGVKEPDTLYALLRLARDYALQADDLETALKATDRIAGGFFVDAIEEKLALIAKYDAAHKTPAGGRIVVSEYLKLADHVAAASQTDAALHALTRAARLTRALKDDTLSTQVKDRTKAVQELARKKWAAQWTGQDPACEYYTQGTYNQRTDVWQTHPVMQERSFKWKRKVRLAAGEPCWLRFEVSGRAKDPDPCDWQLKVVANGKELLSQTVAGTDWKPFKVDLSAYAGTEVELELWNGPANTWHFELAYWDNVQLSREPEGSK